MIFSTSKTELQLALQKLSKATPTRSTLPILGCVLIDTREEKTILKTTDLEITIKTQIPSSLEVAGVAALPIKTLLEITNELPETRLTLSVDERKNAKIKTDLGEYDLMARSSDDFPSTPTQEEVENISIPGGILKEVIDATVFAVSRDELKPSLTGVLFQMSTEGITAVSTDGHRLVKHSRSDYFSKKKIKDIVVPKKFLSYLSTHINNSEVNLFVDENHLTAKIKNDKITTRLIGESFPNYESVIPTDNKNKLVVNKKDLLGAIKRVSIFSNKSTHQVALSLDKNNSIITTEDPEKASKAQESLAANYVGDPINIGYNAEYLKDVVSHVSGEEIVIDLNTPVSAALFSSPEKKEEVESTMLLMPIRLNE
tara:strand:- start:890 stop:2002 length:1113 start_codon:yes stop_codon:yes gene_type:complete